MRTLLLNGLSTNSRNGNGSNAFYLVLCLGGGVSLQRCVQEAAATSEGRPDKTQAGDRILTSLLGSQLHRCTASGARPSGDKWSQFPFIYPSGVRTGEHMLLYPLHKSSSR